ncbi:probable imidazolonepropionase isoform X3 [Tyto alba]|uniref:probable imidazolonepropionase isoform X3 n=1 Tax=Tyto alba TaxID=56313 RepID=UPI001C66FAF9|nr:probable imidazolonepropionase isoform X3 [Tyto alba]
MRNCIPPLEHSPLKPCSSSSPGFCQVMNAAQVRAVTGTRLARAPQESSGLSRALLLTSTSSPTAGRDGCIKAVGPADVIRSQFSGATFERIIDCSGKCVLPGDRCYACLQKMLLRYLQNCCPGTLGKTATEATDDIINNHLPKLKELKLSGEIHVNNIDVFCEKGVFDLESTRRILQAGKDIGLQINFHGDELHPMKSAELGAELGARAISHLEEVSDEGIAAMARAKCAAVLLPTTAYMLRLKQPQARKMLEEGVIVALGSDFNPNAYCFSMPMVMHLACVNMRMSMNEALAAATINAAYALGKSDTHGSIETGKQGDLVIINSSRWEHLIYQFGGHETLINYVIVKGKVIYENERCGTMSSY